MRLLCSILLLSSLARADQPPPEAQAKQHFERGVALIAERRWNDAIIELEAARAVYPTAPIHFNLGLAYRATGRSTEAIAAFERYRRAVGDNADPQRQAEVNRYLATLRASLAQLRLDVLPANASVLVDGAPPVPGVVEVDPGKHTVVVSAEGYAEMTRTITLTPGSTNTLQLHLQLLKSTGTVHVVSTVGDVRIDGVFRGRSPVDIELQPGKHLVEVTANGYLPERREIAVEAGGKLDVSLSPKPERKVGKWVALGLGLAAVVGVSVGLGVAFGVKDEPPLVPQLGVVYTGLKVTSW